MKNKITINLAVITFLLLTVYSCTCQKPIMETTKNLDIKRFMGKWYEIARFDHSFERGLVGVTATYTLKDDGKITVLNQGYRDSLNGKLEVAIGKAKMPDAKQPGRLKVSFFWIFYAQYNVLLLDEIDYQYALIGSKSDKYLWILCRKPQMQKEIYDMLIAKAEKLGYDTSKLILVKQNNE